MENRISNSEWVIMEVLWEKGEVTQAEIMDSLDKKWKKNTVYTFLSRLETKGLVNSRQERGGKRFSANRERAECVREEKESFLNKVYHGSAGKLVASFLEDGSLTAKERQELMQLLEEMGDE